MTKPPQVNHAVKATRYDEPYAGCPAQSRDHPCDIPRPGWFKLFKVELGK